jgi:hypothetical protein
VRAPDLQSFGSCTEALKRITIMSIRETPAGKAIANRQTHWNFGNPRGTPVSLDEFLAEKEAAGVEFFAGKEPWLKGIQKLSWQTFFRVCTEEMDDLSQRAIKLVIEYCLGVLEEVAAKIPGKVSIARLEAALDAQYAQQPENQVYQYRWALRHPVVKEAITRAMGNRFPSR